MLSRILLTLICPITSTVTGLAYNVNHHTSELAPADLRSLTTISHNEDAIRVNASNKPQIQCDGDRYGLNPNLSDCQNARSYYKRSKQLFTYGERHSGHDIDVFPLPYRLMGGNYLSCGTRSTLDNRVPTKEPTDAGRCYLQPVLIDSSLGTGTASINHLSDAAYELILQCVVRQSTGGIATGIGRFARPHHLLPSLSLTHSEEKNGRLRMERRLTLIRRKKYGTRLRLLSAQCAMWRKLRFLEVFQEHTRRHARSEATGEFRSTRRPSGSSPASAKPKIGSVKGSLLIQFIFYIS